MKPTQKQKELCENLKSLINDSLNTWITTNDIQSPSHYTLIDESVENDDKLNLTALKIELLRDAISDIYDIVKCYSKN